MDSGDRFRYIGHGKFIADCFADENRFLHFTELLRTDLEQVMKDEQLISVRSDADRQSLIYESKDLDSIDNQLNNNLIDGKCILLGSQLI